MQIDPRQKGTTCVEGEYRFHFAPGYLVCRSECSPFYSCHAQNFCNSCKEMDFMLYHPGKKELWLIEVKDYRFNARPKVQDLVEKPLPVANGSDLCAGGRAGGRYIPTGNGTAEFAGKTHPHRICYRAG